jgi:hypothetical protein
LPLPFVSSRPCRLLLSLPVAWDSQSL